MDEPTPALPAESPAVADRPASAKPTYLKLSLVVGPLVLLTIGNYVAAAILFTLIKHHPAWLIALSPTTRNLLLVAKEMPLVTFFALGIARRMLPHPLWFLLGRWYGDAGIRWVEKRFPDIGAMVGTLEKHFPRYGWLICIVYPHPLVCTMAGASAMSFVGFCVYTLAGIVGYVWTARATGHVLAPATSGIANFGQHYWIPLTALTVAMVLYGLISAQLKGRSKIESISQIESELNDGGNSEEH